MSSENKSTSSTSSTWNEECKKQFLDFSNFFKNYKTPDAITLEQVEEIKQIYDMLHEDFSSNITLEKYVLKVENALSKLRNFVNNVNPETKNSSCAVTIKS